MCDYGWNAKIAKYLVQRDGPFYILQKALLPLSHPKYQDKDPQKPGVEISCRDLPEIGMLANRITHCLETTDIKGLLKTSVPISGGVGIMF